MTGRILILVAALGLLCACGTPGAPRPPSLRLAETVRDLAASRQGSTVTLTWTMPQRTTDGENLRTVGSTLVCMGIDDFPMTHCDEAVADLSQPQFAQCAPKIGMGVNCSVTMPLQLQIENRQAQATYAVEVLNQNGRSAGLSNQVRVPMAVALPAASHVGATIKPDAVVIEFTGIRTDNSQYHVFRSAESAGKPVDLGIATPTAMINTGTRYGDNVLFQVEDRSFEWEKNYVYQIVGITNVSLPDGSIVDIKGDPTPDVKIFTADVFPPAAPQGLQAVASGVGQQPFIDLTWAPNTESDLGGYNVYRHEEGADPIKINAELVKAPSYRDAGVQRGKTYFYSVSAVDLRNNESPASSETSEVVH